MKKNGFTLIEMLAVVVLIGLIIGLIVYNVSSSIRDSKESVSEASANSLVVSLEEYYFQTKVQGVFSGCSYDFNSDINTCTNFMFSGEKPTGGIINLSVDGVVSGNLIFDDFSFNIINNTVIK